MSDEPQSHDEKVEAIKVIIGAWLQNLARNAVGEGWVLEPIYITGALVALAEEYNELIMGKDGPDWTEAYSWLDDGRGTE